MAYPLNMTIIGTDGKRVKHKNNNKHFISKKENSMTIDEAIQKTVTLIEQITHSLKVEGVNHQKFAYELLLKHHIELEKIKAESKNQLHNTGN